jgi:hypothetical protein
MKKIIVVVVMILIFIVCLSGCIDSNKSSETDEDRVIGTWYISEVIDENIKNITYIFSPDKSYEVIVTYKSNNESFKGIWKIEGKTLIVTFEGEETLIGNYQFSNNDKTLTITDITTKLDTVLTKQE